MGTGQLAGRMARKDWEKSRRGSNKIYKIDNRVEGMEEAMEEIRKEVREMREMITGIRDEEEQEGNRRLGRREGEEKEKGLIHSLNNLRWWYGTAEDGKTK